MRITGSSNSLPLNIAKAYGVKPPAAPRAADNTSPIGSIAPARKPDSYQPNAAANQLVAGKVTQAVSFDGVTATRSVKNVASVLPMYTRAADKMEAAVAVQIGRSLDVMG